MTNGMVARENIVHITTKKGYYIIYKVQEIVSLLTFKAFKV
jgi:hypothetical protein